jgi:hypothetical protein
MLILSKFQPNGRGPPRGARAHLQLPQAGHEPGAGTDRVRPVKHASARKEAQNCRHGCAERAENQDGAILPRLWNDGASASFSSLQ